MTEAAKIRWAYFGLFVLTIFGTLFMLINYLTRDPLNRAICDRIQPGMTAQEVTRLLGPCRHTIPWPGKVRGTQAATMRLWVGSRAACEVFFDAQNRVVHCAFLNQVPRDPFQEALRRAANLRR